MNNIDLILSAYNWNLEYAKELCADIPERIFRQKHASSGLTNHPAWTIGHLALTSAQTRKHFTDVLDIPADWKMFDRKGPGDESPIPTNVLLPSKQELIDELERQHLELSALLKTLTQSQLDEPCNWFFSKTLPTLGEFVHFRCVVHESMHLGQLAPWRRSFGIEESAMARLK